MDNVPRQIKNLDLLVLRLAFEFRSTFCIARPILLGVTSTLKKKGKINFQSWSFLGESWQKIGNIWYV